MDLPTILAQAPIIGLQGFSLILIYLLGRRVGKLESMLFECLQSGGKVDSAKLDGLDKP